MTKEINPKYNAFITIDAWFCCKCHCYNPIIVLDFEVPKEYIPKSTNRECIECENVTRVGTKGKEVA